MPHFSWFPVRSTRMRSINTFSPLQQSGGVCEAESVGRHFESIPLASVAAAAAEPICNSDGGKGVGNREREMLRLIYVRGGRGKMPQGFARGGEKGH